MIAVRCHITGRRTRFAASRRITGKYPTGGEVVWMSSWREAEKRWRAEVYEPFVKSHPERREQFRTVSQLPIELLYGPPSEGERNRAVHDLGFPGMYPYTRGVYPSMYRGRLWTQRQIAGFGTAESTNERFKFLL